VKTEFNRWKQDLKGGNTRMMENQPRTSMNHEEQRLTEFFF